MEGERGRGRKNACVKEIKAKEDEEDKRDRRKKIRK